MNLKYPQTFSEPTLTTVINKPDIKSHSFSTRGKNGKYKQKKA